MKGVKRKKKLQSMREEQQQKAASPNKFWDMTTEELLKYVHEHNHLYIYKGNDNTQD